MEKIMQLKTIKEYNDYMGVETRHPLVSVIEGNRMPHPVPRTPCTQARGDVCGFPERITMYGRFDLWPTLLRFSRKYVGVFRSGASVRT